MPVIEVLPTGYHAGENGFAGATLEKRAFCGIILSCLKSMHFHVFGFISRILCRFLQNVNSFKNFFIGIYLYFSKI